MVVATFSLALGAVAVAGPADRIDGAATARIGAARLDPPTPPPGPADQVLGRELVELLNRERSGRGLAAVTWHDQVAAAASAHSADMASHRQMSHTGSDGSDAGRRLERAGFEWGGWAENIGAGYETAASMFDGWMNSPGHRVNMLGEYRYVGVAAVDGGGARYWTLVVAN